MANEEGGSLIANGSKLAAALQIAPTNFVVVNKLRYLFRRFEKQANSIGTGGYVSVVGNNYELDKYLQPLQNKVKTEFYSGNL